MINVGDVYIYNGDSRNFKARVVGLYGNIVNYKWEDEGEKNLSSTAYYTEFLNDFRIDNRGAVAPSTGKYDREVLGKNGCVAVVDVYRVLDAFQVTNPMLQHLAKKALCAGLRGHKDLMTDLKDIKQSIDEAIKYEEQKENNKL